jgi:hypothetical protein
VIAVDDHEPAWCRDAIDQRLQIGQRIARVEMDLADEDHVGAGASLRRCDQPLSQAREGLRRHDRQLDQAVFG